MKAVVVHKYGGPEVLKFEDYPDPVPGAGEVLVRVAAASVNPLDYRRRAGLTDDYPGEGPHGARFDSSGGAAAGDDNGQPAPFGYGNQGGPDGFGRRRCGKCRAFGGIHRQGTRGDCDRGGLEEAGG